VIAHAHLHVEAAVDDGAESRSDIAARHE
jgi:hypothetical protein